MNPDLRIETPRLLLQVLPVTAAATVAAFQQRNRAHFAPWDPPRSEAFFTEPFWRDQLYSSRQDCQSERGLRLFLLPKAAPETVIGFATFSNILRGPFQACFLGYGIDQGWQGQGLMTEALQASIDWVFRELALHRIMANYLPENQRSARVLEHLGFVIEGLAREYLYINGAWRDHVLTAKTNRLAPPPPAP